MDDECERETKRKMKKKKKRKRKRRRRGKERQVSELCDEDLRFQRTARTAPL